MSFDVLVLLSAIYQLPTSHTYLLDNAVSSTPRHGRESNLHFESW